MHFTKSKDSNFKFQPTIKLKNSTQIQIIPWNSKRFEISSTPPNVKASPSSRFNTLLSNNAAYFLNITPNPIVLALKSNSQPIALAKNFKLAILLKFEYVHWSAWASYQMELFTQTST